jgi:hypothetical protein
MRLEYSPVPQGMNNDEWEAVRALVAGILHGDEKKASFYFPAQAHRRKVIVLVPESEERRLQIVKVGFDRSSQQEIEHGAEASQFIRTLQVRTFTTPRLLTQGSCADAKYAMYEYLSDLRPAPQGWNDLYAKAWMELRDKTEKKRALATLSWWGSLRDGPWKSVVEKVEADEPAGGYPCCAVHGDLADWNARLTGGVLCLMDWEEFSCEAPVLTDPVHLFLSRELLANRRAPERISSRVVPFAASLGRNTKIGELLLAMLYFCSRSKDWCAIASSILKEAG